MTDRQAVSQAQRSAGDDAPPRLRGAAAALWFAEQERFALWTPVAIGVGVWLFFALPWEPPPSVGWACGGVALALLLLRLFLRRAIALRIVISAAALAALGFSVASSAVWRAAAPVIAAPISGMVEGRVVAIEPRRARGDDAPPRWRLTLDRLRSPDWAENSVPRRVRIDVPAPSPTPSPAPLAQARSAAAALARIDWLGARIRLEARLRPPPPPVEPTADDFRLRAWMAGLGAIGWSRAPPERIAPPVAETTVEAAWLAIERLRIRIAARALAATATAEGEATTAGAVIAALIVGDRSGVDAATTAALRDSNLAHLLAISGLHMGIVCLTVFALLRIVLAFFAEAPARADPKKLAALGALAAGGVYLALSGAAVSTERAFLMAVVAFGAVLVDRPAITLRAVAVAATAILLWKPESLFAPGFQLSFAATTAMVAAFEAMRASPVLARRHTIEADGADGAEGGSRLARAIRAAEDRPIYRWLGALAVSAFVAGVATAPFAAFTFNRLTSYGLLANLAATPTMGLWIMPAAVAALVLAPFGLDGPAFQVMGWGVDYVLWIAETVAAAPSATRPVAAGPPFAIGLIALGGLWLCLWRTTSLRAIGVVVMAAGAADWASSARPDVLIAPRGALIGVATPEGRALDRARRESFVARRWLGRDGDRASPSEAAARPGFARYRGGVGAIAPHGWRVETIFGRAVSLGRLRYRCRRGALLVLPASDAPALATEDGSSVSTDGLVHHFSDERWCVVFDRTALQSAAPFAIWIKGPPPQRVGGVDELTLLTALLVESGDRIASRLWTDPTTRDAFKISPIAEPTSQ